MNQTNNQNKTMDRIDKFLSTPVTSSQSAPTIKKKIITDNMTEKSVVSFGGSRAVGSRKKQNRPQNNNQRKNSNVIMPELTIDDEVIKAKTTSKKTNKNALRVVFLGGIGEIGKNMTALEFGDDIIIIDCGLAFPGEDMPGVDLVIPDFTYVKQNYEKIKGIVITHGHEDHIGALPYLLKEHKIPVYGSKMALTLLENKFHEHKITGIKQTVVKPRVQVSLGVFTIEFVKVNHSIPGAYALAITTPLGIVFHTGDFKIDFEPIDGAMIDLPRIAEIGKKGVKLLMCESTNVERPGYTMSESSVGEKLERIFIDNKDRRIFVATFSSNIYRIQQILDLAVKYDRRVAVVGRSMINNIDAGMKIGEFRFSKDVFVDIEKVGSLEDKRVLVLSTGSQGEPMSALSRLASGEFTKVEIGDNDTVIFSSTPIPGNENMVNKVINNLYKKGAIVIHEDVHTSGHACQEELKTIHSLLMPEYFIPVHGEYRHLKEHTNLAARLGMDTHNMLIPEIGDVVEINSKTMVKRGTVPAGELLVDGLGIGDAQSAVLRDRKLLSEDGLVIVVMGISSTTGELTSEPYMITRGFVYTGEADALVEEAKEILLDNLKLMDLKEIADWNDVRMQIRKPLRNFFYKKTKRNPMILPIIFRV